MGDSRSTLAQLADILADLYDGNADVRRIALAIGMRPGMIQFDSRGVNTWSSVVREADALRKLDTLVATARRDYPDHPGLDLAARGRLTAVRGPDPAWQGSPEKIIGANTLLPAWFLRRGFELAQAVGRIELAGGATGTGFLIGADLVLTNHHVLDDAATAAGAFFQLNFQTTAAGLDEPVRRVPLAPARGFHTHPEHDWTAVRLAEPAGPEWGVIDLRPRSVARGDSVFIIQHPGGGPKQVALGLNEVAYAGEGLIQYLTDTMPGSSGSPVFDRAWNLVALHHSGGWLREPNSKTARFRNEGIAIDVVHADLVAQAVIAS